MAKRLIVILALFGCLGCECTRGDSSALLGHYRAAQGVMMMKLKAQERELDELKGLVQYYIDRGLECH